MLDAKTAIHAVISQGDPFAGKVEELDPTPISGTVPCARGRIRSRISRRGFGLPSLSTR